MSSQGSSSGTYRTASPWLGEPANQVEADLAAALEEARARTPDEVTMRRLWSKVASPDIEQPTRSRWPWFVGGVVTSSALAVAVGIWVLPALPHARLHFRDVDLSVVENQAPANAPDIVVPAHPGKPGSQLAGDAPVPVGPAPAAPVAATPVGKATTVHTNAGQIRRLALRGGTAVRLSQASTMTVTPLSDGTDRPTVEKGDASFSVPHQAPGHNFSVVAGPYRIVVIGTKFRLHVEGVKVAVAVDDGVVEVWRKHRLVRLATGDSWSSPFERGGVPADGPANGPAEPQVASPAPVAPAAPVPAPAVTAPAAVAPAPVDPMQEAKAALAAGDPNRALDFYRAAISRGGPAAENAEYEIGRVQRDRLRQPAEAIATWKRYRSSHPNGLLRIETDVSIIEALVASDDSSALAEANDFLRQHGDSERRAEIARIVGDLYRERSDYGKAVSAYQTALAASRTREVTEYASFQRAACLIAMGQPSGNAALEQYLRAWPQGRFSREANHLLQGSTAHTTSP